MEMGIGIFLGIVVTGVAAVFIIAYKSSESFNEGREFEREVEKSKRSRAATSAARTRRDMKAVRALQRSGHFAGTSIGGGTVERTLALAGRDAGEGAEDL